MLDRLNLPLMLNNPLIHVDSTRTMVEGIIQRYNSRVNVNSSSFKSLKNVFSTGSVNKSKTTVIPTAARRTVPKAFRTYSLYRI